jgi:phage terminase small subunit
MRAMWDLAVSKKRITTKAVQETENLPLPPVEIKPEVDDEAWDSDGLTVRQRAFVEALVGPAGGNATKAAEMAGYAAENRLTLAATASENLRKPYVQEALARALARRRMSPEWAQERLLELASASMRNFAHVENGDLVIDWDKAAAIGAIGQIGEVTEEVLKTEGTAKVIKRKFKLHNPKGALETILKLTGLLKDELLVKAQVHHTFDLSRLSDDELRNLRETLAKARASAAEFGRN